VIIITSVSAECEVYLQTVCAGVSGKSEWMNEDGDERYQSSSDDDRRRHDVVTSFPSICHSSAVARVGLHFPYVIRRLAAAALHLRPDRRRQQAAKEGPFN